MSADQSEIILTTSPFKVLLVTLFLLAIEIVMVWLFFYGTPLPDSVSVFYQKLVSLFNALIILYLARQVYRFIMLFFAPPRTLITATPQGIEFPRLGLIPWDTISHLKPYGFPGLGLQDLGVFLYDFDAFVSQYPRLRRQFWSIEALLGYPHIVISGALSPMPAKELMIHLEALRQASTGKKRVSNEESKS